VTDLVRRADDSQGEALGWWFEGEVGSTVAALIRDSSDILDSGLVCEGINVKGVQMKHGEGNHEDGTVGRG